MVGARSTPDHAVTTREKIIVAAREHFSAVGYEASGVRDIAATAGVNPALVIRHFGSKERLFIDTIGAERSWSDVLEGSLRDIGPRAVRAVFQGHRHGYRAFGAMLRASGRPEVEDALRRSVAEQLWEPLAAALDGPKAALRAHLFCAQLTGLLVALAIYDDELLAEAPVDDVVELYGRPLQDLIGSTRG